MQSKVILSILIIMILIVIFKSIRKIGKILGELEHSHFHRLLFFNAISNDSVPFLQFRDQAKVKLVNLRQNKS